MAKQKKKIKAVIFAGGVGTRMWPLSRIQTPKQFEKMVDGKSTLQLTVSRLRPRFDWKDIYISTGIQYINTVKKQLSNIPSQNIVGEPKMRDVAPAVGYLSSIIAKEDADTPMVILWSDHLLKKVEKFRKVLEAGGEYIRNNPDKILFIGQKPKYPNQNLGWIQRSSKKEKIDGLNIYKFKSWHYRPNIQLARQYSRKKTYSWNTGYFIATPSFILKQYQRFMPGMYRKLVKLQETWGTKEHQQVLKKIYPSFKKISFDDAILEKLEQSKGAVVSVDFGWDDIGNWQALKEALQKEDKDNITKGKVVTEECQDSLVYNFTDQLVTTIDLDNIVVVNTKDVLLVCTDESMKNIKKVVKKFKAGKKYKKFT